MNLSNRIELDIDGTSRYFYVIGGEQNSEVLVMCHGRGTGNAENWVKGYYANILDNLKSKYLVIAPQGEQQPSD